MAVVEYTCDTCERKIDIPRNEKGLEIIGRCIITDGCRGRLYQSGLKQDFQRGEFPPPVIGLDDYIQRRALYNHDQTIPRMEWTIEHNFGICPIVQVLIDRSEQVKQSSCVAVPPSEPNYVEPARDDYQIIHDDEFTTRIVFERAEAGIAQAITKTTALDRLEPVKQTSREETFFQLTNQSELTIGVLEDLNLPTFAVFYITYLNQQAQNAVEIRYEVDNVPSLLSPWRQIDRVEFKGEVYEVRSFNVITAEQQAGRVEIGSPFYISKIEVNLPIQTANPTNNSFIVQGNVRKQFTPNQQFQIAGGTNHTGTWSVRTATYDALLKQTTVFVDEMVLTGTDASQESITTRQPIPRDLLFLLSDPPFQTTDRINDEVVDVSSITETNAINLSFIRSGDLFLANDTKQDVFPLIRRVV